LNQKEGLYNGYKMEDLKKIPRQVAIKTTIQNLLLGEYIQEKENEPNYLLTNTNQKIFRINLIAIVLSKEKQGAITNFVIDDGTGKIALRSFEENKTIDSLNIGNSILIIGKIRTYNQEKYISPEIIKLIDAEWLKLRSIELKHLISNQQNTPLPKEVKKTDEKIENEDSTLENNTEEIDIVDHSINQTNELLLPIEKITKLIKELDAGEGVLIEEIISTSQINETEKLLEKMLENGDIFQNSPGKVKVL
jgi:RPA family protein